MSKSMSNNQKARYWSFVVYPDSLPNDWQQILIDTHIKMCISPLHEYDVNPTGEVKKAHYHVLVIFEGPTTFNRVNSISNSVNGTICQVVSNVPGLYRYFTHKDNPEKYQYNESDIVSLNGFNILDYNILSNGDLDLLSRNVIDIIERNNIVEYYTLINFLKYNPELTREYNFAYTHTRFLSGYLESKRFYRAHKLDKLGGLDCNVVVENEEQAKELYNLDKKLKECSQK